MSSKDLKDLDKSITIIKQFLDWLKIPEKNNSEDDCPLDSEEVVKAFNDITNFSIKVIKNK